MNNLRYHIHFKSGMVDKDTAAHEIFIIDLHSGEKLVHQTVTQAASQPLKLEDVLSMQVTFFADGHFPIT